MGAFIIISGIVAVLLTGMATYITLPIQHQLYYSAAVQNMTGQARQTADTIYQVATISPMLFIGGIFLAVYAQAARKQADEVYG